MMEWLPLIIVVTLFCLACFGYATWETNRVKKNPDLGPAGQEKPDLYWGPRSEPNDGPPIRNDPGGA
jgi:hypothetical protein